MGLLDRLLGRDASRSTRSTTGGVDDWSAPPSSPRRPASEDEAAIARYRYMLRTAPPETVEQAHAEAFARLTPAQRQQVLAELSREVPASERGGDDPASLARTATRAEVRQPGTLERLFSGTGRGGYGMGGMGGMGGMAGGIGLGGVVAGSLLASVAGAFIGTELADAFSGGEGYDQGYDQGYEAGQEADAGGDGAGSDTGDAGADSGGWDGGWDGGGDVDPGIDI